MAPQDIFLGGGGGLGGPGVPALGFQTEQIVACRAHFLAPRRAHSASARCWAFGLVSAFPQATRSPSAATEPQIPLKLVCRMHLAPPSLTQPCIAILTASFRFDFPYDQPEIFSFQL